MPLNDVTREIEAMYSTQRVVKEGPTGPSPSKPLVRVIGVVEKRTIVWDNYHTISSEGISLNGLYSSGIAKDQFRTSSKVLIQYDTEINDDIAREQTGYKNAAIQSKGDLDKKVSLFYLSVDAAKRSLRDFMSNGDKVSDIFIRKVNETIATYNVGEVYKARIQITSKSSTNRPGYKYSESDKLYHATRIQVTRYFGSQAEANAFIANYLVNSIEPITKAIEYVFLDKRSRNSVPTIAVIHDDKDLPSSTITREEKADMRSSISSRFGSS